MIDARESGFIIIINNILCGSIQRPRGPRPQVIMSRYGTMGNEQVGI